MNIGPDSIANWIISTRSSQSVHSLVNTVGAVSYIAMGNVLPVGIVDKIGKNFLFRFDCSLLVGPQQLRLVSFYYHNGSLLR